MPMTDPLLKTAKDALIELVKKYGIHNTELYVSMLMDQIKIEMQQAEAEAKKQ